jgi:phosphate transport system substrate-binding protein
MKNPPFLRLLPKAVVLCLATSLLPSAARATDINGSGSTFVHPLMLTWAAHYHDASHLNVSYRGIGSGAGIRQIKAGIVTFAASDMPLTPEELRTAGLGQFPLVIGGVVPVVNLQGVKPGQLNFSGELLADIYLGKITNWNDPSIASINPGLKLPDLRIVVTHRSDGSGTTFNWANFLSKVNDEWKTKVGEGTTVRWPTGEGAKGNEGVALYVNNVPGSIGYVELAFALDHKMTYANLRNRSGVFITPSLQNFEAAATNAGWKAPDFYEVLTDAPGKDAWPITATVFVLMYKHPKDAPQSAEALEFFRWALEQGKSDAQRLNYVSLPESLVKQIEEYWAQNIK